MRRKTVLFITGKDPTVDSGGYGTFARAHARAALRAGYEPHLLCVGACSGSSVTDYGHVHRLRSFWRWTAKLPGSSMPNWTLGFHTNQLVRAACEFLQSHPQTMVVHSIGNWCKPGVLAARQMAQTGRRVLPITSAFDCVSAFYRVRRQRWPSGASWRSRLRFEVENLVSRLSSAPTETQGYERSHLVLVNYRSVQSDIQAECRKRLNIRHFPYASELAFSGDTWSMLPVPPILHRLQPSDAPLIVCVSRHDAYKGIDVLLTALALLSQRGTPFRACLVGGGHLLDVYRQMAARLCLGDRVMLTGYVPDSVPYLAQADIFVHPAIRECSGSMSLLEAMQLGKACIASGVDGLAEDITDGDNGLLFPPGDAEALAQGLFQLLRSNETRQRLGQRARQTYETRFSASNLVAALGGLYAELEAACHPKALNSRRAA